MSKPWMVFQFYLRGGLVGLEEQVMGYLDGLVTTGLLFIYTILKLFQVG